MITENILSIPNYMAKHQEETIKKEKGKLLNFIRARVSSMEDAEDILQDVLFQFVNGYVSIHSLEKATAWLFRTARNKIIDTYRKRKVAAGAAGVDEGPDRQGGMTLIDLLPDLDGSPEDLYFREVVWETINAALQELPKEQRNVFIENELEGINFRKLSLKYNVGVNTLISRKRYAVMALRKKLEDLYMDL